MKRLLETLARTALALAVMIAVGFVAAFIGNFLFVPVYDWDQARGKFVGLGEISRDPLGYPGDEVVKSNPNPATPTPAGEPASLYGAAERMVRAARYNGLPRAGIISPSETMNKLYHIWYTVPVELFRGPGEEEENSKEILSESLTFEQIAGITQYYDEAVWDPGLAGGLYAAAKKREVELAATYDSLDKGGPQQYEDMRVWEEHIRILTAAVNDTVVVNNQVFVVEMWGWKNPHVDQYYIAFKRWDTGKIFQLLSVDSSGNVLPYMSTLEPWVKPPRLLKRQAEDIVAALLNIST